MSFRTLLFIVLPSVWIGYMVGGFTAQRQAFDSCKTYYKVLPEKEKPQVCSEVMDIRWIRK